MAPQRAKSAGKRRARAATPRWLVLVGVLGVLGIATWAGVVLLAVESPTSPREGSESGKGSVPERGSVPKATPAHADIDEADRERLLDILRKDEVPEP